MSRLEMKLLTAALLIVTRVDSNVTTDASISICGVTQLITEIHDPKENTFNCTPDDEKVKVSTSASASSVGFESESRLPSTETGTVVRRDREDSFSDEYKTEPTRYLSSLIYTLQLSNTSGVDSSTNFSRTSVHSNSSEAAPLWQTVLENVQVSCTLIGAVTNLFTVFTLLVNHDGFSRLILTLIRHQALIDFVVCSMASTLILEPYDWRTGFYYVDVVVCYAWHSQALYWVAVTASTYNLILVAVERYVAVCKPFRHSDISSCSRVKLFVFVLLPYLISLLVNHGSFIQTRFSDGDCLNDYAFSGPGVSAYFFAYVIFSYFATYLIPAVLMAICYGLVVRQLRLRRSDQTLGRSTKLNHANDQLTKTAVSVTIVFICTIGYDIHYYLLGYTGVTVYELNSPVQKIGVFLSNLNSSVSPFIYAAVMPIFRRSVARTLCCKCGKGHQRTPSQNNSVAGLAYAAGQMRGRIFQRSLENRSDSHTTVTNTSSQQSVTVSVVEIEVPDVAFAQDSNHM